MNSRLIDAEEVKAKMRCPNCHSKCFGCNVDVCCELIDSVPTIEAIPVEWIKKWIFEHPYFCVTGSTLLGDWQKEQGKEE